MYFDMVCLFLFQFRNFKIVYRRYAGLYFCICVDVSDNNLMYLEAIHNFVEVLNEYFHNVCELDLVFNFYKVRTEFTWINMIIPQPSSIPFCFWQIFQVYPSSIQFPIFHFSRKFSNKLLTINWGCIWPLSYLLC